MLGELAVAFRMAKGYRLRPWESPYLKWRVETWSGLHAEAITPGAFARFAWVHRRDLWRYLHWASAKSDPGRGN